MGTIRLDDARAKLAQLHAETAAADPFQPVPPIWIAEMHRALGALATAEQAQRYRLDGVQGVNMAFLHRRIGVLLDAFGAPAGQDPRRQEGAR